MTQPPMNGRAGSGSAGDETVKRRICAPVNAHSESLDEELVEAVYRGRLGLLSLADRCGVTLEELARRASRSEIVEALGEIQKLTNARTSIVVSKARTAAARSLLELAQDREAKETARKACMDLLGLRDVALDEERAEGNRQEVGEEAMSAIHRLLERVGAATAGEDSSECGATKPKTMPARLEKVEEIVQAAP